MTISDIAREQWAFAQEDSFGEQIAGRNLQVARITSESLKQMADITSSREIRSDRQTAGVVRTRVAVAGNMDFELSYASFDDLLAAALMSANVKAQGTLTMDTLPATSNTVTIGTTVYTFKDTLAVANDIKITSGDLPATKASFVATINGTGTAGVDYYAGTTTPHPLVEAAAFVVNACVLTAKAYGLTGNAIATTETFTPETNVFDHDHLGTTRAGAGWTAPVTVTAITISASDADNSFNDSGSGFGSIVPGEWIKTSGFTAAADNGYFKVLSATAAKIIVVGGLLVTESAGQSRTVKQGSSIVNGVTKNSFNLERTYSDLTTELALYVGCMINQLDLTVGTNAIVTGSLGVMGKIETSETASGGAGYDAANGNEILNSIDHVVGVYENALAIDILDFNLSLVNNLRERLKIGTLGAFDIGTGQVQVTGTFTAYYQSKTLYDKFLDFGNTSLAKVFQDTAGNGYVIDLPAVKITDAARHAGAGMGDDFKVPCTWQAYRESTEDITIRIVRFAA